MKLIVGLGNPEQKYNNTFHNLGFWCVDELAKDLGVEFAKTKCRALIAEARVGSEKVIIAKPQTYMNLSGESVRELMSFYKIEPSSLIVAYDDFDLKKGQIRVREKGSAGTHNGMRNIIKEIGTENFARVRVGFKPDGELRIPLIDLVLSGVKEEDKETFIKATKTGAKAMYDFAKGESVLNIVQKYSGNIDKK
jgi:PTH1 family peptidyl-tRNA hydrolase